MADVLLLTIHVVILTAVKNILCTFQEMLHVYTLTPHIHSIYAQYGCTLNCYIRIKMSLCHEFSSLQMEDFRYIVEMLVQQKYKTL